jgi:hypothetical protein
MAVHYAWRDSNQEQNVHAVNELGKPPTEALQNPVQLLPDLERVIASWPSLPALVRGQIARLVEGAGET